MPKRENFEAIATLSRLWLGLQHRMAEKASLALSTDILEDIYKGDPDMARTKIDLPPKPWGAMASESAGSDPTMPDGAKLQYSPMELFWDIVDKSDHPHPSHVVISLEHFKALRRADHIDWKRDPEHPGGLSQVAQCHGITLYLNTTGNAVTRRL